MESKDFIPTDPYEIDRVIDLLHQELRPEVRRHIREGKLRGYGVAPPLREALIDAIAPQVPEWDRRDWSDFAHLTANTRYAEWVRAAASAICTLFYLESCADRLPVDGTSADDYPFELYPEWGRLRTALLEVALTLTTSELIDEARKRQRAEAHAKALAGAEEQVRKFRSGRPRGALAIHTQCLVDLINDNPGFTTKQIAQLVRRRAGDDEWPFDVEGDDDVIRASGQTIKLEAAIDNARKRHIRSNSAI